jgi:hypothetical protein
MFQEFSLLLQAAPPSAGGSAAASEDGRGLRPRCRTGPFGTRLAPVLEELPRVSSERRLVEHRNITHITPPIAALTWVIRHLD